MQLGHGLKEAGDLAAAADAYRQAAPLLPGQADVWIHLAHLERRMGRREAALAALERAMAAEGDGDGTGRAAQALIDIGARERLPLPVQQRIEAREGDHALSRYAAWAAAQPAPATLRPDGVRVLAVIAASGASPDSAAVTRETLAGAAYQILVDRAAVGSASGAQYAIGPATAGATHILLVEAGTRIMPDAIAQLAAALAATGAGAAYGDHDHWTSSATGPGRHDPCFQPMFDPVWFRRAAVRPPCLLLSAEAAAASPSRDALFADRMALPTRYAHVPRVLASRRAEIAPVDAPRPAPPRPATEDPIQVVIQTRDAPDMLARCVTELRRTAAHPDALDIVVMDNRSVLPETAALLADWQAQGIARTIAHDEPFNWARANNLAAARGDSPLLLFLNNDVEMETPGWDAMLRAGLAQEGAGALGALLLYPDRLIQHGGVIVGMGEDGGAVHEGVLHPVEPGGPAGRWRHPRLASAVTGAWLAVSRALFDAVGGFEERLPIAYNDVDFCLRVRAAGAHVVQASDIVAIHRESATRGSVMSSAEHDRDQVDWAWMRGRWGAALDLDPGYNPNWARTGQPFDGLRLPSAEEVARWIAASARVDPWAVTPPTGVGA